MSAISIRSSIDVIDAVRSSPHSTRYAFDDKGRPIESRIAGLAAVTSLDYDARGRLSRIRTSDGLDSRESSFDYHEAADHQRGFLHGITDAESYRVTFDHDAAGRLIGQEL